MGVLWRLLLLAAAASGARREVSLELNPGGGGGGGAGGDVLHVRAAGARDTLHYVWSSLGAPAALLVATRSPRSALRLDWGRLRSPAPAGAVWIEPRDSVLHASAVVFTKVFESAGGPGPERSYPPYDLSRFSWGSLNGTLNRTALTAEFRGVPGAEPHGAFANGSLAFRVTAYEADGRDGRLPRLLHTANSSKVEFVLAGLAPRGNGSRFALELLAVEAARAAPWRLRSAHSIDDEYAPSVFETLSLESEAPGGLLSFLQWKATAYGSRSPRREDGIRCRAQEPRVADCSLPPSALVRGYFGGACSASALNISFGGDDGAGYDDRRYLSWSALLGFGQPPADAFSALVVAIVAVALGSPAALLLLGGLALLLARRRRRSDYEPIN